MVGDGVVLLGRDGMEGVADLQGSSRRFGMVLNIQTV